MIPEKSVSVARSVSVLFLSELSFGGKKLFVYTGNGSKLSTDRNNRKIGSFSTKNRNFNTQK